LENTVNLVQITNISGRRDSKKVKDTWFSVGEHVVKLDKQDFEQEGIKKGKLKIIIRYCNMQQ